MICQRLKHTVRFNKWYMFTRTYHTYKVSVVILGVDSGEHSHRDHGWPIAFYPETTPWFMRNTEYPYILAINAYIDSIIEGVKQ